MACTYFLLWIVCSLFFTSVPLQAQEDSRRSARATPTDQPPVVDGRLDDDAWAGASVMDGFVQREPSDGQAASHDTEVRIVFDDEALYVGVWLHDSSPDGIVLGEAIRDYDLEQSDAVMLIFDTFKDEQNAFIFGTNPAGIDIELGCHLDRVADKTRVIVQVTIIQVDRVFSSAVGQTDNIFISTLDAPL